MSALQSMNGNGLPEWHNPHARAIAREEPFVEIRYRSTLCAQLVTSLLHVLSVSSADEFAETLLATEHGGDYLDFTEGILDDILAHESLGGVHAALVDGDADALVSRKQPDVESSMDPFGLESVRSKQFDEDSPVQGRQQAGGDHVGVGSLLRVSGASFSASELAHAKALFLSARMAGASLTDHTKK